MLFTILVRDAKFSHSLKIYRQYSSNKDR